MCEQAGFKKSVRSGIVLETGAASTIDITLDLGQITETVSVTASAPLLESESGGQSIPVFSVAGGRSHDQMWHLDGGAAYERLRNDKLNARTFFAAGKAPLR